MEISQQDLQELIKIHKNETGIQLTIEEAEELGKRLVGLFTAISKPIIKKTI